jgi:hypothetical protein
MQLSVTFVTRAAIDVADLANQPQIDFRLRSRLSPDARLTAAIAFGTSLIQWSDRHVE